MCTTCLCEVTMLATRNQEDGPSSASSTVSDCNDLPTAALLYTPHITGSWATQAPPTLQMRNGEAQRWIWAGYMLRYTVFLPSWAPPIKLVNAARHVLLSTHEPHHSPHLLWPLRDKGSKLGLQAWIKGLHHGGIFHPLGSQSCLCVWADSEVGSCWLFLLFLASGALILCYRQLIPLPLLSVSEWRESLEMSLNQN